MSLDKITFILTLYKDNTYTERFLDYFSKLGISSELFIGDGGPSSEIKNLLLNYPKINFRYFEFEDKSASDYFKKMEFLVDSVTTPYLMLCDNDDLFLLEGIEKSISFLEEHEDYVASGGMPLYFLFSNTNMNNNFEWSIPKKYFLKIDHACALERVCHYIQNYNLVSWYHVLRKEKISIVIKEFIKTNIQDLLLMEMFLVLGMAFHGKIHWDLNGIHYVRQLGSSQCGSHIKSFVHRVIFNHLGEEINIFLNTLNVLLMNHLSQEEESSKRNLQNLKELMTGYLEKNVLKREECRLNFFQKVWLKITGVLVKFFNPLILSRYLKKLRTKPEIKKSLNFMASHCRLYERKS